MHNEAIRYLIDENGNNHAVSMFLALFANENNVSIARMHAHLENCGFINCSPRWVETEKGVLTITLAREWIRHLFNLETSAAFRPEAGS